MSARLGPIHQWLYNQIKLVEEREEEIVETFKEEYGSEVEELANELREEYGALKGDHPLAELIGNSQIHPWLEGAIKTAQTREAAMAKRLMSEYDNKELLLKVYKEHGKMAAKNASEEASDNDLETAFELLTNNFVERMPCDRLSSVVKNEEDKIVWRHSIKLHVEFWQAVGVSEKLMHQLYSSWIKGFIKAINSNIKHHRDVTDEYYDDIFAL